MNNIRNKKTGLNIMKTASIIALLSVSSTLMAGVGHGDDKGGHGGHDMSNMKADSDAAAHWMSPAADGAQKNPVAVTADSIAEGSKLYQANCTACHGKNAEGDGMAGMMLNPKPSNLRAMSGGHPDGDFAYKIREGRGSMPGWKDSLEEKQVWHLVNYIQTLNDRPIKAKEGHDDEHSHDKPKKNKGHHGDGDGHSSGGHH